MKKKLEESKEASTLAIKHQTEELENVQEKIRNIRKELDLAEGRPQANNDLEKFMRRQIEELEEELVCPAPPRLTWWNAYMKSQLRDGTITWNIYVKEQQRDIQLRDN